MSKQIQIFKDNKKIKVNKLKKVTEPKMIDIDFTSIKSLLRNKIMFELTFQETKNELIYG